MKSILIVLALLSPGVVTPDELTRPPPPAAAKPDEIRAVMFYITIDKDSGVWTHAQVIGGYKDHDACTRAVPVVGAAASSDLAPNEIPIFLCPVIDVPKIQAAQQPQGQSL